MEIKAVGSQRQASLKRFIFTAILGASLVTFVLVYLVTTLIYHQAHTRQANALTLGLSEQISHSLQQLMEKGWSRKDLFTFLDPVIRANAEVPVGVAIYRADSVTAQFGAIDAAMRDQRVRQVMLSGESFSSVDNNLVRRVVAIKTEAACLSCHVNTQVGDVLGVVEITQDLSTTSAQFQHKFFLVFLLLAPEGAGADHLKALARIARLLRDQDVAKKLRASRDAPAIYSVLALPPASAA